MCSTLVCLMALDIFLVSRELASGESDRLVTRTNCLHRIRSTLSAKIFNPLAPNSLLLLVPLIKCLALISGSGRDLSRSACG